MSSQDAGVWTSSEHQRLQEAIALFPNGPWSLIADYISKHSTTTSQATATTETTQHAHASARREDGDAKANVSQSPASALEQLLMDDELHAPSPWRNASDDVLFDWIVAEDGGDLPQSCEEAQSVHACQMLTSSYVTPSATSHGWNLEDDLNAFAITGTP